MTDDFSRSVQGLLDRQAIRDVVTRYFNAADERDFDALVGCFVDATEVDYSELLPVPASCPVGTVAETIERAMAAQYGPTQHFMGNHVVELDGDSARASTYCLAMHQLLDSDGTQPASALRYLDRLVRGPEGGWLIEHRRVTRDLAIALPERPVPTPGDARY